MDISTMIALTLGGIGGLLTIGRALQTEQLELVGLLVAGNLAIWVVSIVANSPNFDVQPGFAVFRWISVGLTLLCGLGSLGLMRRE